MREETYKCIEEIKKFGYVVSREDFGDHTIRSHKMYVCFDILPDMTIDGDNWINVYVSDHQYDELTKCVLQLGYVFNTNPDSFKKQTACDIDEIVAGCMCAYIYYINWIPTPFPRDCLFDIIYCSYPLVMEGCKVSEDGVLYTGTGDVIECTDCIILAKRN